MNQQTSAGSAAPAAINDGGPAFPQLSTVALNPERGMSLRDHFAGLAMQGMLANAYIPADFATQVDAASDAYAIADAMLRARGAA